MELAEALGMRPLLAQCHLALGELSRNAGQGQEAQQHLTIGVTMFREMGMQFWLEKADSALGAL